MRVYAKTIPFTKSQKTSEVIYGGCWHIGNPNSDKDAIGIFMDRAKRKPWWHVGDIVEAIGPGDKRFHHSEHKDTMLNSIAEAGDTINKARGTCWGTICGNHEWGASGAIGDVAEDIATRGRVPYLGACCYFDVRCPDGRALIFTAHGNGSMGFNSGVPERDAFNRRNKLRGRLRGFGGETGVPLAKCVAHYHRTIIAPPTDVVAATVRAGEFKRRPEEHDADWVMACPSLFKNYDDGPVSYAEMALYPPTDLGWLGIAFERSGKIACVREYDQDGALVREVERKLIR